jgi:hypothetical protein
MSVDVQLVFEDQVADLFHLVGFGFAAQWLDINDFRHCFHVKDRVTAFAGTACESGTFQDVTKIGKIDVGVGTAGEDVTEDFMGFAHRQAGT